MQIRVQITDHNGYRVFRQGELTALQWLEIASLRGSHLAVQLARETAAIQEMTTLHGDGGPTAYEGTLTELDTVSSVLRQAQEEVRAMAAHVHAWNEQQYCAVCGADGRA